MRYIHRRAQNGGVIGPRPPLDFDPARKPGAGGIGCVHRDGSITYQGTLYRTLRDVPSSCIAFRADLPATVQWRKLYRAVDPKRKPQRDHR